MSLPPSLDPKKKTYGWWFLRIGLALVAGLGLSFADFDGVESYFYDFRLRTQIKSPVSEDIVIILTGNSTVEKFKKTPTLNHHTKLIEYLAKGSPKSVVYVTDLKLLAGNGIDQKQFADQSTQIPDLFQVTDELETKFENGTLKLPPPMDQVSIFPGPRTRDNSILARDGVTRRMLVSYQGRQTLHPYLAQKYNPEIADKKNIKGLFTLFDSEQVYIQFRPRNSFATYKFEDVYSHSIAPEKFKDKIILVGDDLGLSIEDYLKTPYSREVLAMPRVEMHANMLNTLIQNSAPRPTPEWMNVFATVLISIITIHVVLTLMPLAGLGVLLLTLFVFGLFNYVIFFFGWWLPMAHGSLALFLCYYFFIPYRLIVENRRSWEYYQKNKLLSQVEELKTNFIGMMSHDLKTPLARIQGMTDVILSDSHTVSSIQREAIDTIRYSSEDLLKFINKILDYARIESEGVQLHKVSKDVNEIIKEVVKRHEFLAKLKHIQIIAELEPLFSIHVDPDLIRQVFSNLVENAIKYSPENSKVLITTEEIEDRIIIQVADQGMGIEGDELLNIFMKFFRSKHAKSSPIKGSGLGLYLARYFVELHGGRIFCESTTGQGSTFTVELPLKT